MTDPMARLMASVDAHVRAGYADVVTDTLKTLSRREPVSLAEFLRMNSAALMAQGTSDRCEAPV
jgi:hypothetical protein